MFITETESGALLFSTVQPFDSDKKGCPLLKMVS